MQEREEARERQSEIEREKYRGLHIFIFFTLNISFKMINLKGDNHNAVKEI